MDLKLKFKIVALATKYKNQIDFGYINNAIKEYCSYNFHLKTISNIGVLDESLSMLKSDVLKIVGKCNDLDLLGSYEFFDSSLQSFCKLLGINFTIVIRILERYLVLMKQFIQDALNLGCQESYAFSCCVLYLNYISIPSKYMKEYFDYVKERY